MALMLPVLSLLPSLVVAAARPLNITQGYCCPGGTAIGNHPASSTAECYQQCEKTDDCEVFTYNKGEKKCYLKESVPNSYAGECDCGHRGPLPPLGHRPNNPQGPPPPVTPKRLAFEYSPEDLLGERCGFSDWCRTSPSLDDATCWMRSTCTNMTCGSELQGTESQCLALLDEVSLTRNAPQLKQEDQEKLYRMFAGTCPGSPPSSIDDWWDALAQLVGIPRDWGDAAPRNLLQQCDVSAAAASGNATSCPDGCRAQLRPLFKRCATFWSLLPKSSQAVNVDGEVKYATGTKMCGTQCEAVFAPTLGLCSLATLPRTPQTAPILDSGRSRASCEAALHLCHEACDSGLPTWAEEGSSCPLRCSTCSAGGPADGGTNLTAGKCRDYCSTGGHCGTTQFYRLGTNCNACGPLGLSTAAADFVAGVPWIPGLLNRMATCQRPAPPPAPPRPNGTAVKPAAIPDAPTTSTLNSAAANCIVAALIVSGLCLCAALGLSGGRRVAIKQSHLMGESGEALRAQVGAGAATSGKRQRGTSTRAWTASWATEVDQSVGDCWTNPDYLVSSESDEPTSESDALGLQWDIAAQFPLVHSEPSSDESSPDSHATDDWILSIGTSPPVSEISDIDDDASLHFGNIPMAVVDIIKTVSGQMTGEMAWHEIEPLGGAALQDVWLSGGDPPGDTEAQNPTALDFSLCAPCQSDGTPPQPPPHPQQPLPQTGPKRGRPASYAAGQSGDPDRPFACVVEGCTYTAKQRRYVTEHMATHTGHKPHKCQHPGCAYSTASSGHLKRHQRKHTGEKPIVCNWPGCSFATTQPAHLRAHSRTHTGEKPFMCQYEGCTFTAARMWNVTRHMAESHRADASPLPQVVACSVTPTITSAVMPPVCPARCPVPCAACPVVTVTPP